MVDGKRITIRISAECIALDNSPPVGPPVVALPPPVAGPPPQAYVEHHGPYYGPSSIYDRRLYRRGDLPPHQRLAPY
jgi:hypothetical protein